MMVSLVHHSQVDLEGLSAAGGIHEALLFPGCADFQPLLYINGLAHAIVNKYGGRIFERSQVTKTQGRKVTASTGREHTGTGSVSLLPPLCLAQLYRDSRERLLLVFCLLQK
jgi:glycine/D-amino acid oxidase-like deaminating enzyme